MRSRLVEGTPLPELRLVGRDRPVGPVRRVEERALPIGGLLEEVVPGDLGVVRRIELAVLDGHLHGIVDIPDKASVERQARERRKEALSDTEGHVGAARIAPFGDDIPVPDDHPVRLRAVFGRAEDPEAGLPSVSAPDSRRQILRVLVLIFDREGHRPLDEPRIHSDLAWIPGLPVVPPARKVRLRG